MVVDIAPAARLHRGAIVLVALIALALLPVLAHASPPDPVWLQGVYDDDDFDDIVTRAVSGSADVPVLADEICRCAVPLEWLPARDDGLVAARPVVPVRPRGPPSP